MSEWFVSARDTPSICESMPFGGSIRCRHVRFSGSAGIPAALAREVLPATWLRQRKKSALGSFSTLWSPARYFTLDANRQVYTFPCLSPKARIVPRGLIVRARTSATIVDDELSSRQSSVLLKTILPASTTTTCF